MKILIAYASKNGTTAECANQLQALLKGLSVTVCDLSAETPSLDDFDIVVLGSSVRFGKLLPPMRRFLKEQKEALLKKNVGIFLCCGLAHEYEDYFMRLLPFEIREAAFRSLYFGGSLKTTGVPLFDRLFLHMMRSHLTDSEDENGNYTPALPGLLPENIQRMADYIRTELLAKQNG